MSHGVSIARAKRLAKRSSSASIINCARVGDDGRLQTTVEVDLREAHLKQCKTQDVRVIVYESGSLGVGGTIRPIATASGKKALVIPLSVHPRGDQDIVILRVGANLPDHAGKWVDLLVERVRPSYAPFAIIPLLVLLAGASIMLNSWGDPTARKGHYEGKTKQEIQADLDQDIAWYEMEISVASRVTMAEGSTTCELRVENVESNHCDQKVKVWETGSEDDVLFESGAISPGEYLQTVELAHPLEPGTHTLTVQFQGYEQQPTLISDEGQLLGHDTFGASCTAEVTLEDVPAFE